MLAYSLVLPRRNTERRGNLGLSAIIRLEKALENESLRTPPRLCSWRFEGFLVCPSFPVI